MPLMLVHPRPAGQDPPPKRPKWKRSEAYSLTDDEVRHLRAALQGLRRKLGGWRAVAEATGIPREAVSQAGIAHDGRPHPMIAIKVARAARVSLEALLAGTIHDADVCPACGRKKAP